MIPGELFLQDGEIELNVDRATQSLMVANTGDRPIQVGSHYHFAETNAALDFDRAAARGYRLNIAAGTAVRFEPGQTRTIELVALAGARVVYGFAGATMGPLDAPAKAAVSRKRTATQRSSAAVKPKPKPKPATKNVSARNAPLSETLAKKNAKKTAAKKMAAKKVLAKTKRGAK